VFFLLHIRQLYEAVDTGDASDKILSRKRVDSWYGSMEGGQRWSEQWFTRKL